MTKLFSKRDTLELIALAIKAISGVVGGSLILTEGHPYLTLGVLAAGAAANEMVVFIQKKKSEKGQQ